MAESEPARWSFLSRILVIAGAALVVAIAVKPYQGKIRPYLNGVQKIRFELPSKQVELTPVISGGRGEPAAEKSQALKKKKSDISEGDRSELEAILNRL